MRKLWMAGVLAAAALFAQGARADDAAKERREAADATKAEMKQDAREVKSDVKQKAGEARAEMKEEGREARTAADRKTDEMRRDRDAKTAQAGQQEKKHPLFEGKDNFNVEGKIQKVSKDSITLSREELPAATLKISKDTKVELDGEHATATQLKQGQDVKASFNLKGDKPEAVEIKAEKADK
jgi:flagellar biosynthesis GTPase FlhF